jgi:uncharacterized protein (TIGR03067 family)
MKTKLLAVALVFGVWSLMAAADGGRRPRIQSELDMLKGNWKLISEVAAGQNVQVDATETFYFNGRTLVDSIGGKVTDEFTIKIDPSKNPKEIDLIPLKQPNMGQTIYGIYKIEGDMLILCANFIPQGNRRPKAFESNQNNKTNILTMKKEK